jgi:glycosyltransferase involved in cell wall biosynthesis
MAVTGGDHRLRVVSVQTSSEQGGAEYANVDLLDALHHRGHHVVLVTDQPDIVRGTPVPVRPIALGPKLGRGTWLRVTTSAPLYLWRLARTLRALEPQTTILHFKKEQLLAALLPRRVTGRVVWAEWGPLPLPMRHGLPRRLYAAAARRADRIVCVSRGTADSLIEAGAPADRVEVIPNLLDVGALAFDADARRALRTEWGVGPDTFVIGAVARLHPIKRNDVIVDAMGHLDGDVLLVISGEGEDEDALRRRAAPYGDRVRFLPTQRGTVERFLSACDVQVFAPAPMEGAPRSISLGQLVGIPVIATDGVGADELITDGTGTIVQPSHDAAALARVLEAYRVDGERRAREGAAGRAVAHERHDPERVLSALESALDPGS